LKQIVFAKSWGVMGELAERLKQLPQGSRIYKLKELPSLLADASQVDRLYNLHPPFGGGHCHCIKSPFLVILQAVDAA
jgi:hypothetical protein